jgi:seryl-tRNA synthetase
VGIYRCAKCSTKFPSVVGRRKYRIARLEEWQKLEEAQARLEDLVRELEGEKVRLLNEVRTMEEKTALIELRYEAEKLENEVVTLRRDKRQLQEEIDRSLAHLEAIPVYR